MLVLAGVRVLPRWPGLPHLAALPPLDLFADVRVLYVRAPSWPVFVVGVLASVSVRTAVLSLLVGVRRAVRVYAAALVPALLAGALQFSAVAGLYHWFFWAGLAITIVTFLAIAVTPALGLGGRLAYMVVIGLVAAVATAGGSAAAVALVVPTALLTVVVLREAIPSVTGRVVLSGAAVLAVAVGAWATLDPLPPARAEVSRAAGSLFLVAGHGTSSGRGTIYKLDPRDLGYACEQTFYFSYRGPGSGSGQRDALCPIRTGQRYRTDDTRRPLGDLADAFRAQVRRLEPPVVVVGHSQGGWIAWRALAEANRPLGVSAVVLVGPLPHTSVDWHGPGEDAMRAVMALGRARDWTTFRPGDPLPQETLATAGALDRLFAAPLPEGVRALTVTSMLDLPVLPDGWRIPGAEDTCPLPVTHSGLVDSPQALGRIRAFLAGDALGRCPRWTSLVENVVHPFGVPPA